MLLVMNSTITWQHQSPSMNFSWDLIWVYVFERYMEAHFIFISSLSSWANNALDNHDYEMEYAVAVSYYADVNSIEMQKLRNGWLMLLMLQRFKDKSSSLLNPDYSLYTYCAHQGTLTNMLAALKVFKVAFHHLCIHSILHWKWKFC